MTLLANGSIPAIPPFKPMLAILGGVATWAREPMLERQREASKCEGRRQMPLRVPTFRRESDQTKAAVTAGEKPTRIAKPLGVARSSVYPMLDGVPGTAAG